MLDTAIDLMERGYVPDWLTRIGIRRLLAERLCGQTPYVDPTPYDPARFR